MKDASEGMRKSMIVPSKAALTKKLSYGETEEDVVTESWVKEEPVGDGGNNDDCVELTLDAVWGRGGVGETIGGA